MALELDANNTTKIFQQNTICSANRKVKVDSKLYEKQKRTTVPSLFPLCFTFSLTINYLRHTHTSLWTCNTRTGQEQIIHVPQIPNTLDGTRWTRYDRLSMHYGLRSTAIIKWSTERCDILFSSLLAFSKQFSFPFGPRVPISRFFETISHDSFSISYRIQQQWRKGRTCGRRSWVRVRKRKPNLVNSKYIDNNRTERKRWETRTENNWWRYKRVASIFNIQNEFVRCNLHHWPLQSTEYFLALFSRQL